MFLGKKRRAGLKAVALHGAGCNICRLSNAGYERLGMFGRYKKDGPLQSYSGNTSFELDGATYTIDG